MDNAAANLGLFKEAFIKKIGLTPDVYYGRVKVGRLIRYHPRALELLEAGDTHVSILQMVCLCHSSPVFQRTESF